MDIPLAATTPRPSGLSMLLGTSAPAGGRMLDLPLDSIVRNESQPRTRFDQDELVALASSIEARGVIQPIAVREVSEGRYELIAGERRWLASQRVGLRTIPAVLHDVDEHDALVLAVVENVVRQDLNALEAARAYQSLLDEHGISVADLARALGKSRPAVANTLRLLELPDDVLELILGGQLSEGHGRALLQLADRRLQRRYSRLVVDRALSVRATEALVRDAANAADTTTPHRRQWNTQPDPELQGACDRLCDLLPHGVRPKLRTGQRGTKLELHAADPATLVALMSTFEQALASSSSPAPR